MLLLVADDLTASALSCYGNASNATPHLDRLAARGVRFTRAYCQFPLCGPARAALMTGLYPEASGVLDNGAAWKLTRSTEGRPALGEHFRAHGTTTARVGKVYHMRVPGDVTAGVDGADHAGCWTERFNCPGPEWATAGVHEHLSNEHLERTPGEHYDLGFGTAFYTVRAAVDAARQPDALAADRAIELLRKYRDEPFFLAVGFVRPHVPLVAPGRFFERHPVEALELAPTVEGDWTDLPQAGIAPYHSARRGLEAPATQRKVLAAYFASVSFVDEQVGRVLDELEALGLADETVVVFTSDHGYHLGEHGFWQKLSLHEEATRIPLVVAGPGVARGASNGPRESAALVEQIDLFPTLAELAGLPVPAHCQGKSLAGVLAGSSTGVRSGAYARTARGHLWRTERWAYLEYADGSAELYDMRADPGQFTNLAESPEVVATRRDLARALAEKRAAVAGL